MASVGTYLNFNRNTEEAFNFYRTVFGGDFIGGIMRLGDAPPQPGAPELSAADKNLVMHVALPICGGHLLMGTDAPESLGFKVSFGNNSYICLSPDDRAHCDKIFNGLAAGGQVSQALSDTFWGAYFGTVTDRYGVQWMINFETQAA